MNIFSQNQNYLQHVILLISEAIKDEYNISIFNLLNPSKNSDVYLVLRYMHFYIEDIKYCEEVIKLFRRIRYITHYGEVLDPELSIIIDTSYQKKKYSNECTKIYK